MNFVSIRWTAACLALVATAACQAPSHEPLESARPALTLAAETWVAPGTVWRYRDNGSDQGTAWRSVAFNDSTWKSGAAPLGYGLSGLGTVVGYGPNSSAKYITTYFRKTFTVEDASRINSVSFSVRRDDGVAVYLNGQQVARQNLPTGALTYKTLASTRVDDDTAWREVSLAPSALLTGTNVLAVEVHQVAASSADLVMDLSLSGTVVEPFDCVPTLAGPADGASSVSPFPEFTWSSEACAAGTVARYEIAIAGDRAFGSLLESDHSFIGRHVDAEGLPVGQVWWRVRAVATDGQRGPWSAARSLQLAAPASTFTVPNGASREEIQAILASAKAASSALVRFASAGTYRLTCIAASEYCLDMKGSDNVIVDGQGAQFIVETPVTGLFAAQNTVNVTLGNFSVDYDPLPNSQARVVALDPAATKQWIDVQLLPGMPDLLAPHMVEPADDPNYPHWAELLDPTAPGRLSPHSNGIYTDVGVTWLGGDRFRISDPPLARDARVGDIFFKQARVNSRSIVAGGNSRGLALDRVTVYASPAGLVNAPNAHGLTVVSCQTRVKEGRYASTDADNFHAPGMTLGPWVENNVFWGAMDDYLNLRPSALDIVSSTTNSVTLSTTSHRVPVGDDVLIYRFDDGAVVERKVLAVSGGTLTLDGNPGTGTRLYAYSQAAPDTVLRRNTLLGGKRYGFLMRVSQAVIEGNVFDRLAGSAIALENHPWRSDEGLASRDVLVIDNEIRENAGEHGSIFAAVFKCDTPTATNCSRTIASVPRALRRISMVGNNISSWQHHAFNLHNGVEVALRCNSIGSDGTPALASGASAISVADSNVIRIEHNRINDPRAGYVPIKLVGTTGVTQFDNGPMADTTACLRPASNRGSSLAPMW